MHQNTEYYFKEGCYIQEWHNTESDNDLSIAYVRVEPRQTTKLHFLVGTTERYTILSGQAIVTVDGVKTTVDRGDVVLIPAGVAQQIENTTEADLLFLAICTPRFKEKNYREIE